MRVLTFIMLTGAFISSAFANNHQNVAASIYFHNANQQLKAEASKQQPKSYAHALKLFLKAI